MPNMRQIKAAPNIYDFIRRLGASIPGKLFEKVFEKIMNANMVRLTCVILRLVGRKLDMPLDWDHSSGLAAALGERVFGVDEAAKTPFPRLAGLKEAPLLDSPGGGRENSAELDSDFSRAAADRMAGLSQSAKERDEVNAGCNIFCPPSKELGCGTVLLGH